MAAGHPGWNHGLKVVIKIENQWGMLCFYATMVKNPFPSPQHRASIVERTVVLF